MFTSYHLHRALAADRQRTLRHEARQHHLVRLARRGRPTRTNRRQAATPPTPEAQPGPGAPTPLRLPSATALAAWQQDQRAA